jgi:hypothetical protein
MPPVAVRNRQVTNAKRIIPNDLVFTSTYEDAREWLDMSCPHQERMRAPMVTLKELVELVKHMKGQKLSFAPLQKSDDPMVISKELMKCADLDGDEALDDNEFEMLWRLCAASQPWPPLMWTHQREGLHQRSRARPSPPRPPPPRLTPHAPPPSARAHTRLSKPSAMLQQESKDKLMGNTAHFVFGSRLDWLGGLQKLIPMLSRSVKQECTLNEGGKYKGTYEYIVEQPAVERLTGKLDKNNKPIIFDQGHDGMYLKDFFEKREAREAGLTMVRGVPRSPAAPTRAPWALGSSSSFFPLPPSSFLLVRRPPYTANPRLDPRADTRADPHP